MHLSHRRRIKEDNISPAKPQDSRRTRTTRLSNEGAARNLENRPKKFRARNPSFSSTEERRLFRPPSTVTESVEESCVALPIRTTASRGADWRAVSRSNSLPSLAASPRVARNNTFIFMYDESEKKSRAVKQPDGMNIGLPVLVQYELTEEHSDPTDPESSSQHGALNPTTDASYASPTVELLQKWDKTEKRNKGMHVMKWLVQVQN